MPSDTCVPPLSSNISQHFEPNLTHTVVENPSRQSHRLSNRSSWNTSVSIDYSKPLNDNTLSHDQVDGGTLQKSSCIHRKKTVSDFSSGSEDYRYPHPHEVDLEKFTCTERISYLGEFDLSDDSSSSSSDENDYSDYGQQLYLGKILKFTTRHCAQICAPLN